MFREMRRKGQLLSEERTEEVLKRNTGGVLAIVGDDDYPYALPMSYVYADGKIYFHGAKVGHKVDAIKKGNKVSFCVIDKDEIKAELFTTHYRSVIAFGKVRVLEDENEKMKAMLLINDKYAHGFKEKEKEVFKAEWNYTSVFEIAIEYLTGKESGELVKMNKMKEAQKDAE